MDFISWNNSARSKALAEHINADYSLFSPDRSLLLRHSLCFFWTIKVLWQKKPSIIFIQYSFLLLCLIVAYKKTINPKAKIITDCHTKAFARLPPKVFAPVFIKIRNYLFSNVAHIFIHNNELLPAAKLICNSASVLIDPIPHLTTDNSFAIETQKPLVTFVCSFDTDEPVDIIAAAAQELSREFQLLVTGKPTAEFLAQLKDTDVIATGYLKREEYLSLLAQSRVIVGLTTEEYCLQCSGYEALALGKAFVTSNTISLRNFFGDAAILTNNDQHDLIAAIRKCSEHHLAYAQHMKTKAIGMQELFENQIAVLNTILREDEA